MKTLAYCILHYGKPFFGVAVASLIDQVDHIVILYTATPSQGFAATMPCPDTEEELQAEVAMFSDKITWVSGTWANEGEHNNAVMAYTAGYDWLIRFDSDEIYQPGTVAAWIEQAKSTSAKDFRAPFVHFWRSFGKVCRDAQNPQRMIRLNGGDAFAYLDNGYLQGTPEIYSVLHMGYAQPDTYIQYKMGVQGHHNEWRPDWYESKWRANAQVDVHPVVFNFWNAEDFNQEKLPELLKKHPYYGLTEIPL